MKVTNKDGWCIILLTAIQLGYSVNFSEETLQSYLNNMVPVPPLFTASLEKEAIHFSRQICLDGMVDEANKIAASI